MTEEKAGAQQQGEPEFKRSNTLFSSFYHAGVGIGTAFRERNFKIDLAIAALALVLAGVLHAPAWGWVVIVVCIGVQLCAETFNTAIEAVVDLASPGFHELARRAKDCAAGAALITAIMSVAAGLMVYGYSIAVLLGL